MLIRQKVKEFFRSNPIKVAILACLVAVVFGLVTQRLPQTLSGRDLTYGYGSDSPDYWDMVGNLLARHAFMAGPNYGFVFLAPVPGYSYVMQRLPGYPLFLAAIRGVFPHAAPLSLPFALGNLVLLFFNTYALVAIFEKYVLKQPPRRLWVYGWVVLFLPFLAYSNGINSDFLSAVLTLLFCYFFLQDGKAKYWSILFGVWAVFTRGNVLFFIVPFVLLMLLRHFRLRQMWLLAGSVMLAIVLVMAGWSWRNYEISGYFKFTTFIGLPLRENYLEKMEKYSPAFASDSQFSRWNSAQFRADYFNSLTVQEGRYKASAQIDSELISATIKAVIHYPKLAVKAETRDFAQLFLNEYFIFNVQRNFPGLFVLIVCMFLLFIFNGLPSLAFGAAFLIMLLKKQLDVFAILVYSAFCYAVANALILGVVSRYLLPVDFVLLYCVMYFSLLVFRRFFRYNK